MDARSLRYGASRPVHRRQSLRFLLIRSVLCIESQLLLRNRQVVIRGRRRRDIDRSREIRYRLGRMSRAA